MPNCPSCHVSVSPDSTRCRNCGASIPEPATTTADLEQEILSHLDQGRKINAVEVYKKHTGSSLKDAKDAVEAFQRGACLPAPKAANADLEPEVLRLVGRGENIQAIKLYKHQTGTTLYDAKRAVEEIAERNGMTLEGAGCSGVMVLSFVVLVAMAVTAVWMVLRP